MTDDFLTFIDESLESVEFEAEYVSKKPLRGPQIELIEKAERHVAAHEGGVMTVKSARQTGKNETAAILQRRHLLRHQNSAYTASWIRTAPTHKPQIVNSKKRLRELMGIDHKNNIDYPLFGGQKVIKEEGYIWRVGNAEIQFLSSGPHANVVGGTASTCLDMDEAHKIDKAKFDEDFAPFTANTDAATLLWGVGGNGLDTLQEYIDSNIEIGRSDLNLCYPCDIWMEIHEPYRKHVEGRVNVLGWDHPIIQTQYKLNSIAALGRFLNQKQIASMLDGNHERHWVPEKYRHYEMLVDIAAANEDFDPDALDSDEVKTDSTVVWIYEVIDVVAENGIHPYLLIRNLVWLTGTSLESDEEVISDIIEEWGIQKVTIDAVGVGRQIAETMEAKYGESTVFSYHATAKTVSEDCYNLLARLNFATVKMFNDDDSPEYKEFVRQCGWTQYAADKGKMNLNKPKPDRHIDMVKALTYINRNNPVAGSDMVLVNEGTYE